MFKIRSSMLNSAVFSQKCLCFPVCNCCSWLQYPSTAHKSFNQMCSLHLRPFGSGAVILENFFFSSTVCCICVFSISPEIGEHSSSAFLTGLMIIIFLTVALTISSTHEILCILTLCKKC